MISFSVYRWKDSVWINGESRYRSGEILCDYLNVETSKIGVYYNLLRNSRERVRYPHNQEADNEFDSDVQYVQRIFDYLDEIFLSLKPFRQDPIQKPRKLFAHLNQFDELFFDNRFGQFTADHPFSPLNRFEPAYVPNSDERIQSMNRGISDLIQKYIGFCEDMLRANYICSDFLDHYFHIRTSYPTDIQAASAFQRYLADHPASSGQAGYKTLVPFPPSSGDYGVLNAVDSESGELQPILCEVLHYGSIGPFLMSELFYGIQTGQIPRRCSCCGRYFLLADGYYPEFCDSVAPGEKTKTCREVGAKKKHDAKVKSNPVWLAHQRAYKTHYARYMKKKMTEQQFKSWSKFAVELRDRMLAESELPQEKQMLTQAEYEAWLKE